MGIVLAIVFAIFFAGIEDDLAPWGALFGYVLGRWLAERSARARLDERFTALEGRLTALEAAAARWSKDPGVPQPESTGDRPPAPEARRPESIGVPPVVSASYGHSLSEPAPLPPTPLTIEPPAAASPAPPPEPGLLERAVSAVHAYLFGGNTVVRVGVIIVLFGVGFLVKYAADNDYFPIEARLVCTTVFGLALLVVGWRLRARRPSYAVNLQGGGIGVIYLVVFAAFRLYELVPQGPAFALLVVLGAATAVLAVLQDAFGLACMGVVGGFLAPVLVSTGAGDHVVLFSYYAVINAGIVAIAWFKSWRFLNLLGFFFTFVIGTSWGVTRYSPEHYASAQFFLALFFLFYAAISVLFALRQGAKLRGFIDGTLVFGLPLVAFSLQAGLVKDMPYGLAVSSATLAVYYVGLATLLFKRAPQQLRALTEAFLALGVGFVTLTIPFALSGQWTGASWALEGAGLVWVGKRQDRRLPRVTGVLLQLGAAVAFASQRDFAAGPPVVNAFHLGGLLIALAGLACAFFLQRGEARRLELGASVSLLVWGLMWHVGVAASELEERLATEHFLPAFLAVLVGTALAAELIGRALAWKHLRWAALALGPAMLMLVAVQLETSWPPLEGWSAAAWLSSLVAWLFVLRRQEGTTPDPGLAVAHALTAPLLALLCGRELALVLGEHVGTGDGTWPAVGEGLAQAAVLMGLAALGQRRRWPVAPFLRSQLLGAGGFVAARLVLWSLGVSFTVAGDPSPLPYLPIVNPLELAQAFVFVAWLALFLTASRAEVLPSAARTPFWAVFAGLAFVSSSAVVARSVHHFAGVAFDGDELFASVVLQTALSITWAIIALAVTALASRKGFRRVWFVGGALLAVVVCKLFVIDLSSIGTVGRIVSFLVVGVLLLLIGWISPVPPRATQAGATP